MYLKSIEVQGFKSFANKIKFEFHNGVTCIVGPNGSGKSNVSDAVRWVFGEQSAKQLRSSSMQDVIFAGTQLRKPLSFAEVTITLDNADRSINMDTDEVSVTRKVYRSGESEYRLNGSQCRLKDVMELFYDTGIGKEGYSIIGQGQVDKILSGKAEERRELFDEACGIVKFKKRKTVALKKLENEQANMLRVTDILTELERQVGPLKRQSETAKEYLRLKEELRDYDINAFLIEEDSINKNLGKTEESLAIANADLAVKQEDEAVLKKNYVDVDDELQTMEWKIDQQRTRVNEAEAEKADLLNNVKLSEEKINSETNSQEHYRDRMSEIDVEIKEKEQKNLDDSALLVDLSESIASLTEQLNDKNREIDDKITERDLYRDKIDESHTKVIDILNEKSEAHAEFERLKESIVQGENRVSEYGDALKEATRKKDENVEEQEKYKKLVTELQQTISDKNNELSELNTLYTEAVDEFEKARNNSIDLQEKYQIARGRIESLKALIERYEGFNPAVRRVMELKSGRKDICGTVADLVSVDKKYRTMIETALGGNYQNVIVDKEAGAKELVEYLKENKAGRATFLPLDAIKASGGITDPKILKENGVLGTCDKLVKADKKYDEAVRYLLERFLAVDNIENALKIAKKYHYTVRIVTLEGEFLNVGGSITGGAYKTGSNTLGRTEELSELEKKAEEYKTEIEKLQKKQNQYKQVKESYSVELQDLQEEIHQEELKLTEAKVKYDSLLRTFTLYDNEVQEISGKKTETEKEVKAATSKRDAIENALRNLDSANSESEGDASKIRSILDACQAEVDRLTQEREAISVQLSNETQKSEFTTEAIAQRKEDLSRITEEKGNLAVKLSESEDQVLALNEEIKALKEDIDAFGDHDKDLRDSLRILMDEKERMSASQREYFEKRDAISSAVADLQKEVFRLESLKEKAEEKLNNLTEYLWTEYEMTPSEAQKYKKSLETDETPQEIRKHAAELKASIKGLGNVNVNAIDEYKEVSERYEFLKGQYDDLKKAEESLTGIIDDLNNGMRKQFSEQFELIKKEFNVVFSELFNGGVGDIELQPDMDVIESDISIISQPPGKKLQNMMQLSGGEKALTAIALIFAMQRLKPSPFCLLDEIEAALDDTNVVRFANYVKNLTEKTQYIIITHRRGTMVSADRLYGITMQEKGVSALVSVNLVEKELDK